MTSVMRELTSDTNSIWDGSVCECEEARELAWVTDTPWCWQVKSVLAEQGDSEGVR